MRTPTISEQPADVGRMRLSDTARRLRDFLGIVPEEDLGDRSPGADTTAPVPAAPAPPAPEVQPPRPRATEGPETQAERARLHEIVCELRDALEGDDRQ